MNDSFFVVSFFLWAASVAYFYMQLSAGKSLKPPVQIDMLAAYFPSLIESKDTIYKVFDYLTGKDLYAFQDAVEVIGHVNTNAMIATETEQDTPLALRTVAVKDGAKITGFNFSSRMKNFVDKVKAIVTPGIKGIALYHSNKSLYTGCLTQIGKSAAGTNTIGEFLKETAKDFRNVILFVHLEDEFSLVNSPDHGIVPLSDAEKTDIRGLKCSDVILTKGAAATHYHLLAVENTKTNQYQAAPTQAFIEASIQLV